MACAHTLKITPRYLSSRRTHEYSYWPRQVEVPCGYCVNCRTDYKNYVVDRANWEYCNRLVGAFVTFTYDTKFAYERCSVRDPDGSLIFDDDIPRLTLNYDDLKCFLNSIRHYVQYHTELHNKLCQPDFSYLYCGEYGEFKRPHFHVLFFGLDFAYCKKIIFDRWKYGLIDVLPILDGAINYVCKYMDKFEKGFVAEQLYDFKGLARPKLRMSQGFGQGLLWNNVDDIIKNDYCYYSKKFQLRPISQYWKLLLTGNVTSRDVTKKNVFEKKDSYLEKQKNRIARSMFERNAHHSVDIYDEDEQSKYKKRVASIREANLTIHLHNNNIPVAPFESLVKSKFGFVTYDGKRLRRCSVKLKRELVDLYFDSLYREIPHFFKEA